MGKIAFLYPGQGSQKIGMGKELALSQPALFERYLVQSDRIAENPVSRLCLEGPFDALSQTHVAQPALFAYSLALTEYAAQLGLSPDMVAGHSLGEYTAAVAAGALSFQDGLSLVVRRGRLMKTSQDERPGAMAAVLGLAKEALDALCHEVSEREREVVLVTNCNAPGQLVASGTVRGVHHLVEAVRAHGKAIHLPVKGAFHSPLMERVQAEMSALAHTQHWNDAVVPLVANVSGRVLKEKKEIRQELIEQITHPVQWIWCVERLVAEGCDTLVELGSGQVLTKLVRLIAPHVTAVAIDTPTKLEMFVDSFLASGYDDGLQVA